MHTLNFAMMTSTKVIFGPIQTQIFGGYDLQVKIEELWDWFASSRQSFLWGQKISHRLDHLSSSYFDEGSRNLDIRDVMISLNIYKFAHCFWNQHCHIMFAIDETEIPISPTTVFTWRENDDLINMFNSMSMSATKCLV